MSIFVRPDQVALLLSPEELRTVAAAVRAAADFHYLRDRSNAAGHLGEVRLRPLTEALVRARRILEGVLPDKEPAYSAEAGVPLEPLQPLVRHRGAHDPR